MSNEMRELYDIRDYIPSDKSFILSTFLRGIYYGNEFYGLMPKQIFMDNYKHVGEALVSKATVKVACLKDDPEVILGYSILSNDYSNIAFVYVKSVFRNKGIARSLVPARPVSYSHFTTLGLTLAKKFDSIVFNPFII